MSGLPPLPTHLRIFPSRRAAACGIRLSKGECVETSAHVTFDSLLRSLGDLSGRRYASPLECRLLLRGLMLESGGWLKDAATDSHQVQAALRALTELRTAGVLSSHLAYADASSAVLTFAGLLRRYEQALESQRLADDSDWLRLGVLQAARGELPAPLAGLERVTVEGGASLFGARLDLLSALSARGIAVTVRLPWDSDRAEAFAWPGATLTALEGRAHSGLEVVHDPRTGGGPLSELRAAQLTSKVLAGAPVSLLATGSAEEGARWVALTVRAWLREGVAPEEICVATPDPDAHGAALVDALATAGVPASSPRGERLAGTALGRILDAALELDSQDVPREAFLDFWSDIGREVPFAGGRLSVHEIVRLVRASGARSRRVNSYRDALTRLAARDRHADPTALAALADDVDRVLASLAALPDQATLGDHVAAVQELIATLVPKSPEPSPVADDPDGSSFVRRLLLRAATCEQAGLAAVMALLTELRQAAPVCGAGLWRRTEVHALVRSLMSERRLLPGGLTAGSVAVLPLDDLVETRFRRVVLAGIEPDLFPRLGEPDGMLTEECRSEINRHLGPRLLQSGATTGHGGLYAAARDMWVWLEALASAQEELVVTFAAPTSDEGLSEVVEELQRSLGSPALAEPVATYASLGERPVATLIQHWSHSQVSVGGRVCDRLPGGRGAALGTALAAEHGVRLSEVVRRVEVERRLQGPDRQVAPIDGSQRALIARHITSTTHSASALDTLGICIFRYLAGRVLGLEREEVPTLGPDVREQGRAAHAGLELVYRELIARGGLGVARRDPEASWTWARALFDANAARVLAEVEVHPALRDAALEDAWSMVAVQLARDLDDTSDLEPLVVEHRFDDRGGLSQPALEIVAPAGDRRVRVRGSIDRIDGSAGELLVLDYKRSVKKRGPGRHFQLPVYALVALRDHGAARERMHAAWVRLRDGERLAVDDLPENSGAVADAVAGALWARIDRLLAGTVAPDPDDAKQCTRCDFRHLCRYEAELDPILGGEA